MKYDKDETALYEKIKKSAKYLIPQKSMFKDLIDDFVHECFLRLKSEPEKELSLQFIFWNWAKSQKISQENDLSFYYEKAIDDHSRSDFLYSKIEPFKKIILALLYAGYTNREIGQIFDVDIKTATAWARGKNLKSKTMKYNTEVRSIDDIIKDELIKALESCNTQAEIAKKLGVNVRTIRNYLRKFNLYKRNF